MSDQIDDIDMTKKSNSEEELNEEELKIRTELEKVIEQTEAKNEALKKLLNYPNKERHPNY